MNDLPSLTEAQGREIANTVKSLYELIDFDCVTYIPMRKYDENTEVSISLSFLQKK